MIDPVYQYEVLEFTKEEKEMALVNDMGWMTLDPKMVKRVKLD